jgi:hypothetical protein
MATTTNYSWSTPDDTALVKDGAAAIRSLGTSVDTTTKNLNPSTTLGDIEYRSSTANTNTRLGIGTTGQVLTVAGGVPSWSTPAGAGKVLQVVQATTTTTATYTTTSFADSNLTASITPSLATSKVLVIINQTSSIFGTGEVSAQVKLLRDATTVLDYSGEFLKCRAGSVIVTSSGIFTITYLDSPATTSSTTYKTQGALNATGGSAELNLQPGTRQSQIILMEIGA